MKKFPDSEILSIDNVDGNNGSWKSTLLHFFLVVIIVVSSVYYYQNAYYAYVNVPLSNSLFQDMISNWQSKPIIDIRTDINPCS